MRSKRSQGFSLIEMLIVVVVILIIVAIAIPKLLAVRMTANQTAAAANMRSIDTAATGYASQYTSVGYPAALADLGGADPCTPSSTTACLVDNTLASGSKQGYTFTYAQVSSGTDFTLSGAPTNVNTTGRRYYYSDSTNEIHYNDGSAATAASPVIGS